jgi:hypothetical protein
MASAGETTSLGGGGTSYQTAQQGKRPAAGGAGGGFHAQSVALIVFVPWTMFVLVVCSFAFLFFHYPPVPGFVCLISMMCSVVFLVVNKNGGPRYTLFIGVLGLISVVAGIAAGLWINGNFTSVYWSYTLRADYKNVMPTANAEAMRDAGAVHFTAGSVIDTNMVTGILDNGGSRYCVAPIFDDTQQTTANFWAAGVDCCESLSNFRCDEALVPEARSGVVIFDAGSRFGTGNYKYYIQATKQAAATYGITVPEEPVLVHWVKDAKVAEDDLWFMCWTVVLVVIAAGLVGELALGATLHATSRGKPQDPKSTGARIV